MANLKTILVHGVPTQVWEMDETPEAAESSAAADALRAAASAEAAARSAETAEYYGTKPPLISGNGTWEIWDVETGGYQDTGQPAQGADSTVPGPQGVQGAPGAQGQNARFVQFPRLPE